MGSARLTLLFDFLISVAVVNWLFLISKIKKAVELSCGLIAWLVPLLGLFISLILWFGLVLYWFLWSYSVSSVCRRLRIVSMLGFVFGHIHFLTSPKVQSFLQRLQSLQYYDLCWLLAIRCYSRISYSVSIRWRDLPEYHTLLSLHAPTIFTMRGSVQLLGFGLSCSLTPKAT